MSVAARDMLFDMMVNGGGTVDDLCESLRAYCVKHGRKLPKRQAVVDGLEDLVDRGIVVKDDVTLTFRLRSSE